MEAFGGSLGLWAPSVTEAREPCVLLDARFRVAAMSPGCATMLGVDRQLSVGSSLVDEVLRLLDFNAVSGELRGREVEMIPPLLAITSGGLARGLVRVLCLRGGISTLDAVSAPLRDDHGVVGSLTFFALVSA
jgi:hypothetical protein